MGLSKILFIITILVSTRLLCFIPYQLSGLGNMVELATIILLLLFLLFSNSINIGKTIFGKEILLLLFLTSVSAISCNIYHNQSFIDSFIASKNILFILVYFILLQSRIGYKSINGIIFSFGVAATLIYIIQQVAYPQIYWFDTPNSNISEVEIRNGFYRFRLFLNNQYIIYSLLLSFVAAVEEKLLRKWLYVFFFLVGIYLTLTRQTWFCIVVAIFMYPMVNGVRVSLKKILSITLGICIAYVVYENLSSIIGDELITATSYQFTNEDDVRWLAYKFYAFDYWTDIFNMLFGNGYPLLGKSKYGLEILSIEQNYHLYRSDIGIVGLLNTNGFLYLIVFLYIYYKIFRHFQELSNPLKLYILCTVINLPLGTLNSQPLFWGIIMFMIDNEIRYKKLSECGRISFTNFIYK